MMDTSSGCQVTKGGYRVQTQDGRQSPKLADKEGSPKVRNSDKLELSSHWPSGSPPTMIK